MAKITAYIPEPTQEYNADNQRQILESVNTIKNQLNFIYLENKSIIICLLSILLLVWPFE